MSDGDDNSGDTRLPTGRPAGPPPLPSHQQPKSRGWFSSDEPKPAEAEADDEPGWLDRLTQTLTDLAKDISSITVRTYSAEDVGRAVANTDDIGQVGQLRAYTRIAIDGDTDVCVPTVEGKVDRTLWQLHQQVVDQAQTHRNAMIETLVGSVSGLWTQKK